MKLRGFTLAEVLITLAVIGIVAAITLPALTTKLKNSIQSYQKKVIETKLVNGLNMFSHQENGLNVTYNNTEDFVLELSKYLKMSTVCGKNNLKNCLAYDKISYDNNGTTEKIDVSTLTTAHKLKLSNDFLTPAGFLLADGTPFIISWNNNCSYLTDNKENPIVDPDKTMKSVPYACLDGIYDTNGSKGPNKYGKDILPLFSARVGEQCIVKSGNTCLLSTLPVRPETMSMATCKEIKSKYGIKDCGVNPDYWASAMKMCQDKGMRLPKEQELIQLHNILKNNPEKLPESLVSMANSGLVLWSNAEFSYGISVKRTLTKGYQYDPAGGAWRNDGNIRAICIDN